MNRSSSAGGRPRKNARIRGFAGWCACRGAVQARALSSIRSPLEAFLLLASAWLSFSGPLWATQRGGDRAYFRVRVVDESTGRGIPLVELETVNSVLYVTDSAGLAAVREPGLMGRTVFFHVRSHGYRYPEDGFGMRGFRAELEPGGSITVEMKRVNVAERLYRVTGQGIYRDSVLLGEEPPIRHPLLNGGVVGQDSVINAVYKGQLFWFWGDTSRAGYPLGNFEVSGAASELPERGGLAPELGVDLDYFVGKDGFTRPMCPIEGPGPVWIDAVMVIGEEGEQKLVAHYKRMESLGKMQEHGIAVWNDRKEMFEKRTEWPLGVPLRPLRNPVRAEEDGESWFYFPNPYPVVRVRALLDDILDPSRYQAFTPLEPGMPEERGPESLERDDDGDPVWAWKPNTATVRHYRPIPQVEKESTESAIDATGPKGIHHLRDVETGKAIRGHGGSVYYNPYRRKWVMIALESMGRSLLGEVWYSEGDTLLGPWVYARRVVTHDDYSFYNVKEHPYFDKAGRRLYFEGTYSKFLTRSRPTPRYDYNQIMYRLDLEDERTVLPQPVYQTWTEDGNARYVIQQRLDAPIPSEAVVRFYALAPERPTEESVPVNAVKAEREGRATAETLLGIGRVGAKSGERTRFRALASEPETPESAETADPIVVPLYRYRHRDRGRSVYTPPGFSPEEGGWKRDEKPLCYVWRSPRLDPPRQSRARPASP